MSDSAVGSDQNSEVSVSDDSMMAVMSQPSRTVSKDAQLEELEGDSKQIDPVLAKYQEACQNGDLVTVKQLVESHAVSVKSDFDTREKITGLHWAAINNRLNVVKYLISQGADSNFKAGGLGATPLHWAARYGYVYVIDYLINSGNADVTVCDDQGFNLLHLAVNSSNVMLVCYVLFFVKEIDIDSVDLQNRTSLLWAAYQGDSLTVKLLLKFGANIKCLDDTGFSALHWGTVKGEPHVLKYLIKDGADFFQKTNDGKNCFTIAQELNNVKPLNEALLHCGFDTQGYPIRKCIEKDRTAKIVLFMVPFVVMGVVLNLFAHVAFLFALLISTLFILAIRKSLIKFVKPTLIVNNQSIYKVSLLKSPLIAGVFYGSLVWVSIVWIFQMFTTMIVDKSITSMIFTIFLIIIHSIFFHLVFSNPGVIEPNDDIEKISKITKELLQCGKFDTKNFCIDTFVRKPIRSKFSSFQQRVVVRFDHFCPWVNNDIGLLNHKKFMLFVTYLEIAIPIFVYLCLEFFDSMEDYYHHNIDKDMKFKCLLSDDELCFGMEKNTTIFLLMCWSISQFVWVVLLSFIQWLQILKGTTNYEFNVLAKKYKNAKDGEYFNSAPEELRELNSDTEFDTEEQGNLNSENSAVASGKKNMVTMFIKLTGMEQVFSIFNTKKFSIDTNYGIRQNLLDFWLTPEKKAPTLVKLFRSPPNTGVAFLNGKEVNYFTLYKLPPHVNNNSNNNNARYIEPV